MKPYLHQMIDLVEDLTSVGPINRAAHSGGTDRYVEIPSHVLDLAPFGHFAGEMAEKIALHDKDLDETCPSFCRLIALVVGREYHWDDAQSFVRMIASSLIATLNAPKLASMWKHRELEYRAVVVLTTFASIHQFARIPVNTVMHAVIHAMETPTDNPADQLSVILEHVRKATPTLELSMACEREAFEAAIRFVKSGKRKGDMPKAWRKEVISALSKRKLNIVNNATHRKMVQEVMDGIWVDVNPQTVATSVGWLTAIYRYTEFRPRVRKAFMDVPMGVEKAVDHQTGRSTDSSDGLAA